MISQDEKRPEPTASVSQAPAAGSTDVLDPSLPDNPHHLPIGEGGGAIDDRGTVQPPPSPV